MSGDFVAKIGTVPGNGYDAPTGRAEAGCPAGARIAFTQKGFHAKARPKKTPASRPGGRDAGVQRPQGKVGLLRRAATRRTAARAARRRRPAAAGATVALASRPACAGFAARAAATLAEADSAAAESIASRLTAASANVARASRSAHADFPARTGARLRHASRQEHRHRHPDHSVHGTSPRETMLDQENSLGRPAPTLTRWGEPPNATNTIPSSNAWRSIPPNAIQALKPRPGDVAEVEPRHTRAQQARLARG